jgi:hypothetical protein
VQVRVTVIDVLLPVSGAGSGVVAQDKSPDRVQSGAAVKRVLDTDFGR